MTGVQDVYEQPQSPEIVINTERATPAESANEVLVRLSELGYVKV